MYSKTPHTRYHNHCSTIVVIRSYSSTHVSLYSSRHKILVWHICKAVYFYSSGSVYLHPRCSGGVDHVWQDRDISSQPPHCHEQTQCSVELWVIVKQLLHHVLPLPMLASMSSVVMSLVGVTCHLQQFTLSLQQLCYSHDSMATIGAQAILKV